ncbi:hypothetical protein [Chitinophaga arvensicola]|uniref:DUF5018 domain-containing protein n=1 Tax=Chitinophaga arvensicola TaxID=29529 RepID=A0A1I0QGS6_9BACT|nr:hypothetical protein [Chitinophaga arvensicola]SEW26324.1 hypothetical protein SAMN04488122_1467 [Chitinophaga arvensicola]
MNTLNKYFFAGCLLLLSACTKENAKLPYSEITSFNIPYGNGQSLSAAIDGQDIIVYWPFEQQMPTEITPQITVSDQAAVKPASGAKVALSSATSYTVTAQDGSTVIYKIRIVSVQPTPVVTALQNDWYSFIGPGYKDKLDALYVIRDSSRTHLSVISGAGKKVPLIIDSITRERIYYTMPAVLDTGKYRMFLETGSFSFTGKTDLYYREHEPELEDYGNLTLKRGQTFTLKGKYLNKVTAALIMPDFVNQFDLEVISNTATSVTLRLPASVPAGTYAGGIAIEDLYYRYSNYYSIESPIIVTE